MESVIKSLSPESHTLVLLNGLIHTDDNLALKSIIQQLQMENLDGTFAEGSYAGLYFFKYIFNISNAVSINMPTLSQIRITSGV